MLRRERPIDLELGLARGLALRGGGIVEEGKFDRALDLVDALAGEEHGGRVRVDPPHRRAAMGRGIAQQREHLLLRLGLMHAAPSSAYGRTVNRGIVCRNVMFAGK